jgi:DNA/RNA endonuclease G (NUC1)
VSVDFIEERTGLDFLRKLPPSIEPEIESKKASKLWN